MKVTRKAAYGESEEEGGFSDGIVSNQQDFEQVLADGVKQANTEG